MRIARLGLLLAPRRLLALCLLALLHVQAHAVVDIKNGNFAQTWIDINPLTGTKVEVGNDEEGLLNLGIQRTYNSRSLYDGLFGFGWCSALETRIDFFESGLVQLVYCGAGYERRFGTPQIVDNIRQHVNDMIERLRTQAGTSDIFSRMYAGRDDQHWWRLRGTLMQQEYYGRRIAKSLGMKLPDFSGQTLAEMGVGHSTLVFEKEEVRLLSAQSSIQFIFDRGGRLTGLQHRDGRRVDITYESGKPIRVQNREGQALVFTYGETGKVATVRRQRAGDVEVIDASYEYNQRGDLVEARNAWRNTYRYHYGSGRNMNQVDWPDKTSIRLYYDDKRDWVLSFQDRPGCVENYTYTLLSELHYTSHVLKRCADKLMATDLYEFWYAQRGDGQAVLQGVRSYVKDHVTEIDYEPIFGQPVRLSADGVVTTYEISSEGRVTSRTSGDTTWRFLAEPDQSGFSVLEEKSHPLQEVTRHKTDPWGEIYGMPAAERERQKRIQSATVQRAAEAVAELRASSEQLDQRLDEWHAMRMQRRFESAVPLAKSLDAELQGTANSELGRAGLAQLALVLADQLIATESASVSLALAQFVLEVSRKVESVDAGRAALLIGQQFRQASKPQEAASTLREAIAILKGRAIAPSPATLISLHLELAAAEREAGNPRLALEALRALSPGQAGDRGPPSWPKAGIEEVALIYYEAGLYDIALETALQSRVVFLSFVDPSQQWMSDARDSDNEYTRFAALGIAESILRAQGRFDDALSINRIRVHGLFRGQPPPSTNSEPNVHYASLLQAEALTLTYSGQYAAASKRIETAFMHSAGNDGVRAALLGTRALLSSRLGLYTEAVSDTLEAIRLADDRDGNHRETLASNLSDLGRYDEAEATFENAVAGATRRLPASHPTIADLRVKWAEARLGAGRPDAAIQLLDGAIDSLQAALGFSHWRVTRALVIRAKAAIEVRDAGGATEWATRALSSAYAGGLPEWRSAADHVVSQSLALSGSNSLAIFFAKRAVNDLQHVRSQLTGLDPQSQVSLIRARHKVFENATALLIDAGRIGEAQQVLSMYKLDELQQFTQRNGSDDPRNVRASVDGAETRWHAAIDQSAARLGTVSAELSKLEALRRLGSLSASEERRREQLLDIVDDEQVGFSRTLDAIRREAETSERDLARNALAAAERAEANLRSLLARLSQQSGSRAAALQYIVMDKKIYLLVTTPDLQFSKELSLEGQQLGQLVQRFRAALVDKRIDPRQAARQLYSLLLEPIASELKDDGTRTLMISLTGVLRYVPFGALHDGSSYLIEKYGIALMTEAALTLGMQSPQSNWNVAGLGVSAKVDPDFLALPGVLDEIAAVVRREPGAPTGALPGVAWIDNDFTAERLQSVVRDGPAVIHVASHFRFSPGSDTSSFLLLGDGTRLTLRDMMGSRYRFQSSDLLTLSACETGVGGGRDMAGREIEGLAALAQRQGAPAVLATLWPVADASTATFMQRFYTLRQEGKGLSKSEALQRAQIEMIREGTSSPAATTAASPHFSGRYSHPYFWAPFVLLGNWL